MFDDTSDGKICKMVADQLEFLSEREGSPRPPLPTNRPHTLFDIVYLKRSEWSYLTTLYIEFGRNFADIVSDEVLKIVQKNPRLLVFSHYMCAIVWIFIHSEEDKYVDHIKIQVGLRSIMEVVREHNNDIIMVVQYLSSLDWFVLPGYMSGVSKNVLVMILQGIIEYSHLLEDEDDIEDLVALFHLHPFYLPLCEAFGKWSCRFVPHKNMP